MKDNVFGSLNMAWTLDTSGHAVKKDGESKPDRVTAGTLTGSHKMLGPGGSMHIRGTSLGVLIIEILLFKVSY